MTITRSSIATLSIRLGRSFSANVLARLAIDPNHFDRIDCRIAEDESESWEYDYSYSVFGVSSMPILVEPESDDTPF